MLPTTRALTGIEILGVDPTDHGSNLGVVAALAVGILALIGLLVFLITRRGGGRGPRRRR
jgi:hypothetical protein